MTDIFCTEIKRAMPGLFVLLLGLPAVILFGGIQNKLPIRCAHFLFPPNITKQAWTVVRK